MEPQACQCLAKVSGGGQLFFFLIFKKILIILKDFIYLVIERGGGRKRGRETTMCGCLSCAPAQGTWPATQACPPTGNRTCNHLVNRPMLNPLSYINQGWRAVLTAYPAGPVVTFLSLFPEVGLDLSGRGQGLFWTLGSGWHGITCPFTQKPDQDQRALFF